MPSRTDRRDVLVSMSKLTGIQLEWIDGVDGKAVPDSALPYPALRETMNTANIGSWRGHLNALQLYSTPSKIFIKSLLIIVSL